MRCLSPRLAPNFTTAAGALEGLLQAEGLALPRHAVMGLTGHAWHLCFASTGGVHALPNGPHALDWAAMVERYARTGLRFERFGNDSGDREEALTWARSHLGMGRPLIGFDFHVHEFALVLGYDATRDGFLVSSVVSDDLGAFVPAGDWPGAPGVIELFAPIERVDPDPDVAVTGALADALELLGGAGPDDGQARGTAAWEAWADVFEGDAEIDRAGNAYTLAVAQAARADGAAFLRDLRDALPAAAGPLGEGETAIRGVTQALAPLLTLFPFPAGGHGSVANPGLRSAAAAALRRAAAHERAAAAAIREALDRLGGEA